MRTTWLFLLVGSLVGCGGGRAAPPATPEETVQPEPEPEPEPEPGDLAEPEPTPTDDADHDADSDSATAESTYIPQREDFVCPKNTHLEGSPPPDGFEVWCALSSGVKHGPTTAWHHNGKKKWQGTNQNGNPVGTWTVWYDNGQKKLEEHRRNRELHGISRKWDREGNLELEDTYLQNMLVKSVHYEQGVITRVEEFKAGKVFRRTNYRDGQPYEVEELENGRVVNTIPFEGGHPKSR